MFSLLLSFTIINSPHHQEFANIFTLFVQVFYKSFIDNKIILGGILFDSTLLLVNIYSTSYVLCI